MSDENDFDQICQWHQEIEEKMSKEDVFYLWENMPNNERLHPNKYVCGILKMHSLMKNKERDVIGGAEHDVVYFASESELVKLTKNDIEYLYRCGITWDEDLMCFFTFA